MVRRPDTVDVGPFDDLAGYRRSLEWALAWKTDSLFLPHALGLPGAESMRRRRVGPSTYAVT